MNTALATLILNGAISALNGLIALGFERARVHALIDKATAEGRPLTQAEVKAEIDDWIATIDQVEASLPTPPAS